jgi:IclR family KDG regulon transcriptional repressor
MQTHPRIQRQLFLPLTICSIILNRCPEKWDSGGDVTVLQNAAAVLRLFESGRANISVTEAHRLLGMPKSSAARLLQHMREAGFVDMAGNGRRYQIGSLIFHVARQDRARTPLVDLAEEALGEICGNTGHTGYVSVLDGIEIVVLRFRPGSRTLQVVTPVGQRMLASETAIGRALLARLSDDEVRERYSAGVTATSRKSPQTLTALLRVLAHVREQGWADSSEEALPGVGSTAVAVRDRHNDEMLGFCVSYSAPHITADEGRQVAELLTEAAIEIGTRVNDEFWLEAAKRRGQGQGIEEPTTGPLKDVRGR